jgi:hypothetical protein
LPCCVSAKPWVQHIPVLTCRCLRRTTLKPQRTMVPLRRSTRGCWRRYSRSMKVPRSSTARCVCAGVVGLTAAVLSEMQQTLATALAACTPAAGPGDAHQGVWLSHRLQKVERHLHGGAVQAQVTLQQQREGCACVHVAEPSAACTQVLDRRSVQPVKPEQRAMEARPGGRGVSLSVPPLLPARAARSTCYRSVS